MEGNYAKVLVEKREKVFDVLYDRLESAVTARQLETRSASAVQAVNQTVTAGAVDAAAGLSIMANMVGYATDLERIV